MNNNTMQNTITLQNYICAELLKTGGHRLTDA